MKTKLSFNQWKPAVSPEKVFSDVVGLTELQAQGSDIYWTEMRPAEKGRNVIVQRSKDGKIKDITPKGFNVRDRVHEYGGGAYTVFKKDVYFVNFKDQCIYCQTKNSSRPVPITPAKNKDGSLGKYASLTVSPDGKKLLFVYEKEYEKKENKNFLAVLDLEQRKRAEPKIIAKGYDFYADPVFSPNGEKVAWLQWNHPDMPWDSTELMIGRFENNSLHNAKKVFGGKNISICLPKFDKEDNLYYIMDKAVKNTSSPKNWWNIYCYDTIDDTIEQITSEQAEFGEPHWVFGQSNYDFLPDSRIIAKMVKQGKESLVIIDPKKKRHSLVKTDLSSYRSLKADENGNVFFIGATSKTGAAVYSLNIKSCRTRVLKRNSTIRMDEKNISLPQIITYPTTGKDKSHAYFYEPKNSRYTTPKGEKPPLLVIAHGGPTGRAHSSFSFITQFWTSAGFTVIDVDYRGSTGYGRKYRDRLLSHWGVVDAEDVANAVRYLIKKKKADAARVAVRGGSAGGYMVQRVMTQYPELFKAGASYYGIGDLITLVKETHKFESHYIDNLIGAKFPKGIKIYKDRSPINHLDRIKSPMIIFQGSDDKIVTPDCSREVAKILKKKGIKYEYAEYKGESHGFRMKKNNVDSLNKEFKFYREIFGKD